MSWLSKLMPSGIRTDNVPSKKRSVPEGLWEKCSNCGSALYGPELEENLEVCPKCGHHMAIRARARLAALLEARGNDAAERLKLLQAWCHEAEASGIAALQNYAARLKGYALTAH